MVDVAAVVLVVVVVVMVVAVAVAVDRGWLRLRKAVAVVEVAAVGFASCVSCGTTILLHFGGSASTLLEWTTFH